MTRVVSWLTDVDDLVIPEYTTEIVEPLPDWYSNAIVGLERFLTFQASQDVWHWWTYVYTTFEDEVPTNADWTQHPCDTITTT